MIFRKECYERMKNAVYRLQIPALVPEIFKFEKCVKYANEMTDDVIHSTQYYIKYINRAIFANLQRRPLKLGRLIHTYGCKTFCSHDNSLFSSPHPLDFNMSVIFTSKNVKQGHKLKLKYLYACWIMYMRHHYFANMKIECQRWPEMPLILERSGTQYVAMVTTLVKHKLWSTFSRILLQRIKHF